MNRAAQPAPGIQAHFAKHFGGGVDICVDELCTGAHTGITVLFGASGSGKTTVLRCLAGLTAPDEGWIRFAGETWTDTARGFHLPPQQRHIGFVPQHYALFPHLSVAHNIAFGLHASTGAERAARVADMLRWVGLEGLADRLPRDLSGGQQQRVALARAVVTRPRLLLMDEPLSALDAPTRLRLGVELRGLLRQLDIPSLLVTHDRHEALTLGDDLVVMDQGRMIQRGPVHEVFSHPMSLAVAGIVAMETVQPGCIVQAADGLVTVAVGTAHLTAIGLNTLPIGGEVYVCIRAENVILLKGAEALTASPRNHLPAVVRALHDEGPILRIDLDCGFPLMALLTKQACTELALKPNDRVTVLVKAPQVHLIPHATVAGGY